MSNLHDPASGSPAPASGSPAPAIAGGSIGDPGRDPLSDVLRTVRLAGALFFVWDVSWPYVTPVPAGRALAPVVLPRAQQIISYHVVTEGSAWGGLIGEQPVRLEAGDILLVPHGDAYVMSNAADACAAARVETEPALGFFRQMSAGELPFVVAEGGGGPARTRVVCGFLGCDARPFNPALSALPRLVRIRPPADASQDHLSPLIDYTLAEARRPQPGGHCLLARLAEVMFVEVVRRCLLKLPAGESGWLAGLRDPVVGRALLLLHGRPAEVWTLERLAGEVGASRSRLAECFTRFVGQPPMQYLAQWRIQLGARLLADGAAKVSAVAQEVGYESEAAFSRAFKRYAGIPPAQWRQRSGAATGDSG